MRQRIVVEFDAPEIGTYGHSLAFLELKVKRLIGEHLDQLEENRRNSLEKLYNIKSVSIKTEVII